MRDTAEPAGPRPRVPVLIVGAGPVGLAAACELSRRGIGVRILEAAAEPQHGSRAVQLHPPTLRILAGLDLLDEAEKRGLRIRSTSYHLAGGRTLKVDLGAENEPLMLPQEQTCLLLEQALERLGGRVERSMTVTDTVLSAGLATVTVQGPAGVERIEADWLVAADGVRSRVRECLGIEFVGEQVPVDFLLAEGRISGDFEPSAVHYFLGRRGSIVFASMPDDRVRISGAVPAGYPLTEAGVQALLDERGPGGLRILGLDSVGGFTSQERIASALRRGNCFLIGDSAHTHSPLGGQGLNLGLQDAHNLAWKLAGVVNGTLQPSILDSYEPERRQAAEQIVRATHQFLRVFTLGPIAARVRNTAWSALERTGALRRWFVPLLAGWRVHYPDVLNAEEPARPGRWPRSGAPRGGPLAPGTRTPHQLAEQTSTGFRLVTMGPPEHGVAQRGRELADRYPELLTHRHVHQEKTSFVLLRPDGYVASGGTTPVDFARTQRLLARLAG
ncbi:FAD-dependent oxidoreductase [Kitasatospora sp. NPDC057015]|uniref:FAD-dependent oxidoreductase n=1 Tax=Kitasatospora sp. NPDC057015 TaxID=3346001 RepID=UPI0036351D33